MEGKCATCGRRPVDGCSRVECASRKMITADIPDVPSKGMTFDIPTCFYELDRVFDPREGEDA